MGRIVNGYVVLVVFCLLGPILPSYAASPSLNIILPRGVQRGGTHTLTFSGARLEDPQEVLLYYEGVEVTAVEAVDANQVRVVLNVAANCRLGEHMAQLRTASGVSDFRSFYVGPFASTEEIEPNSTFQEPQRVPLNTTVVGTITNEDVDYFAVPLKQGERLSVEVEAMRLGTVLFDPYLAILDERRFELAIRDDTAVARQDACASIIAPADGTYWVQLRETSYAGTADSYYRLHIGHYPRPTAVFPAGGKPGENLTVTFLGDPAGPINLSLTAPTPGRPEFALFAEDAGGISPSPLPFRLSPWGNQFEQEPNADLAQATVVTVPNALNGVLAEPGDVDCYRFTAQQGAVLEVEAYAQRIRSGVDPVVHLYHADGRAITSNDDARGLDSYFRWTVPETGDYVVRITDHLGRGRSDYVYRVEVVPPEPRLTLEIPRIDRYSQYRQAIFIPQGGRFATQFVGNRYDLAGPLVLETDPLPQGVRMVAEPMVENLNSMPVVFEAAPDAPLGGGLIDFRIRPADPQVSVVGHYENRADFVLGPPNNNLFYAGVVDRLPVVVVKQLPFQLEMVEPRVPLVRDGVMNLRIRVVRQPDFQGAITVEFPFRPPGVGAPPSVTIPADQTEVDYVLNANSAAQLGKWPLFALGSADIQGAAWTATQLGHLEIAEPFVTVELQRTSCEKGSPAQLLAKVHVARPFEGSGQLQLLGLPPHTTAAPLAITPETQEVIFQIETTADSPVGNHKNIFAQVQLQQQQEPIVSTSGVTELQIDAPLVPVSAPAPEATATTAPPPALPTEKPLSRLEKLRLSVQGKAQP